MYYCRLLIALDYGRSGYTINAFGIRWEKLDEDVSFESFEYDNPESVGISKVLLSHPELNLSAVARHMGIQQSLLAAYASGTKKPSKERYDAILETYRQGIGCRISSLLVRNIGEQFRGGLNVKILPFLFCNKHRIFVSISC